VYWKYRCEIFQERAFWPMTIAGNGALSPQDVAALCTGFMFPLPAPAVVSDASDSISSSSRSPVSMYTDKYLNYLQPALTRRRIHFYNMHIMVSTNTEYCLQQEVPTLVMVVALFIISHSSLVLCMISAERRPNCNHDRIWCHCAVQHHEPR